MKHPADTSPRLLKPDMTPLIDVVFLLLVFFLYAVMHMAEINGVTLSLPRSAKADTVTSRPLAIMITADGTIYVNDRVMGPDHVVHAVASAMGADRTKGIIIRADRDSRTGLIVEVMGLLKNAGYELVTLAVEVP
ncbi:MAG: biopolymer transporter ExbD [Proteobacteria bacterium]|nr:biopolymer transporter ExbD [Pseudomonadota bacterium]